jgi:hypothetical protein
MATPVTKRALRRAGRREELEPRIRRNHSNTEELCTAALVDPLVDLALEMMSAMELEIRDHLPVYDRLRNFIRNPHGPDREWVGSFATPMHLRGWFSAFD